MSEQTPPETQPPQQTITWVGEQRLMYGYCGRALAAAAPKVGLTVEQTVEQAAPAAILLRPVASPTRRRAAHATIRVGPKLADTGPGAVAA